MSNIVRFPKRPEAPQTAELDADSIKAAVRLPRPSLPALLAWLWRLLRLPLFLVLYWLRLPVLMVCNLVSVPAMLAFLAGLWLSSHAPQYRPMVWGIGGVSFAAFLLHWAYDSLLMWLAPDGVVLAL